MSVDNIEAHMNGTAKADRAEADRAEPADEAADAPLTPRQVQLILSTWEPVKSDLQEHGVILFMK